jgi:hypothetical protein
VWGLRSLIVIAIVSLCALVGSPIPAWAIAVSWSPNGLFLALYMRGVLKFPRMFEPVHPVEPVVYRWLGVGLVKRIVATRMWPLINGFDPPNQPTNRSAFLDANELTMKGAEICHGATFVVALVVMAYYLSGGRDSIAWWILGFNVALNGYPVMLQRSNRWRIQRARAWPPKIADAT